MAFSECLVAICDEIYRCSEASSLTLHANHKSDIRVRYYHIEVLSLIVMNYRGNSDVGKCLNLNRIDVENSAYLDTFKYNYYSSYFLLIIYIFIYIDINIYIYNIII